MMHPICKDWIVVFECSRGFLNRESFHNNYVFIVEANQKSSVCFWIFWQYVNHVHYEMSQSEIDVLYNSKQWTYLSHDVSTS